MNTFVKSSFVVFCTVFSISYGSQLPKKQLPEQQYVDASLVIGDFKQRDSKYVARYVDSYNELAIPYDKRDNLFVHLKSVNIQEYNGLSVTNWLNSVPCISPLRKGLVKAVPLSDRIFPACVPARWLVDINGEVRQDVSLEFANGTTKVNFTVFVSTDIARELAGADNSVFMVMEWRRRREANEQELRLLEQEIYIKTLLRSIKSQ